MGNLPTLGKICARAELQIHSQQDVCCREEFMNKIES